MEARRIHLIAIAVVASIALAAGAGAHAATSASKLVLQPKDMPSGAKRLAAGRSTIKIPGAPRAKTAASAFQIHLGQSLQRVGSAVGVLASAPSAHTAFAKLKKKYAKRRLVKPIRLPRYGNEQFARGVVRDGRVLGFVVVRSGSRVWDVVVRATPGGRAKLVSLLKKYAAKEKRRAAG